MDLYAYAQIELLEKLAQENGIDVPRLRGYRLMSDEEPMDLEKFSEGIELRCAENLCEADPFWHPNTCCHTYSWWTRKLRDYYCENDTVRWDRIHGWKRRVLKTYIHNWKRRCKKQCDVWNKYAGKEGILYIHARIGGGNWPYYYKEVVHQPWFIEKVDDAFDSTYCDIYARIK